MSEEFADDFGSVPRRFRDALAAKKSRPAPAAEPKRQPTPEEEWLQVRPRETFPIYNARIKAGSGSDSRSPSNRGPPKVIKTTPSFEDGAAEEESSKRKERRKAFLRSKKDRKRSKSHEDSVPVQRPHFRDTVKAPAVITARPKPTLKAPAVRRKKAPAARRFE